MALFTPLALEALETSHRDRGAAHGLRRIGGLPPEPVRVPGLPAPPARHAIRPRPHGASWDETAYLSAAPAVFELPSAVVHSSAGIVLFGATAIRDTLEHTDGLLHFYRWHERGLEPLVSAGESRPGTFISLLTGSHENYFHILFDSICRIAALPAGLPHAADGVLIPETALRFAPLYEACLPCRLIPVAPPRTLRVERLILPTTVHGQLCYHPAVTALAGRIAAALAGHAKPGPPRLYIDRRAAPARPLLNETDVIAALRPLGIVPVRPETMTPAQQIALFANAQLIVAPHGAALANLLFAPPACRVLELLPDAHAHVAFRRLAALRGLRYHCVFGAAGPDLRWTVPTRDVREAAALLEQNEPA